MTMQVSKGEFDRRVKLLEQKVQSSTNDLINRLQAESEAFIEKLRNTQLDIDALREEIENIDPDNPELDSILNNFIKGYNNFASNTLRINDVFDADGQFDGSRIRPLSIETAALSVGTRSQQLDLNGVEFRILPYTNSNNAGGKGYLEIISSKNSKYHFVDDTYIQYGSDTSTKKQKDIAGYMFHYGFGTNTTPKIYKINERRFDIKTYLGNNYDDTKGIYIYAKLVSQTTNKFEEILNVDDVYFYSYLDKLYTSESDNSKVYTNSYDHYSNSTTYYTIQGNNLSNAEITNETEFLRKINDLYTITQVTISSFTPGTDYYYFNQNVNNVLLKAVEYKSGIQYYTKTKLNLPTKSGTTYYIKRSIEDVTNTATTETNAQEAEIIISHDKLTVDNFNNYLTIKLGYINIGMATAKGTYERKVDMTYGQTTIDGRLITTGRIEGNNVAVDLDTGEITGNVKFQLGQGQVADALSYITNSVNTGINNLEIGGRNLFKDSANLVKGWTSSNATVSDGVVTINSSGSGDSRIYQLPANGYWTFQANQYYTVSVDAKGDTNSAQFTFAAVGGGWLSSSRTLTTDWKRYTWTFKPTTVSTSSFSFYAVSNTGTIYLRKPKLEYGQKATDWSPAPEDMEEGGWSQKTTELYKPVSYTSQGTVPSSPSLPSNADGTLESSLSTNRNGWFVNMTDLSNAVATGSWYIFKTTETYKVKDGKIKGYFCSAAQVDEAMTSNLAAMKTKALVAGGLYIGSKLGVVKNGVYNSDDCAFLDGTGDYAFYAGNQQASSAPVWIKKNGTAKFQQLFFNGSNISSNNSNFSINFNSMPVSLTKEAKIKITTSSTINTNVIGTSKYAMTQHEDYGPYSLSEAAQGFLAFDVSFDYVVNFNSVGSNITTVTFGFCSSKSDRTTLHEVQIGNVDINYATSTEYTKKGHFEMNNIQLSNISNSEYYYGVSVQVSKNTGSLEYTQIQIKNVNIIAHTNISDSLTPGFHIYNNGIYYYKDSNNYFILVPVDGKLKCINSLGL